MDVSYFETLNTILNRDAVRRKDLRLVTNFFKEDEIYYRKAIELYENAHPQKAGNLFIIGSACDIYGFPVKRCKALWVRNLQDLSEFWRLFDHVKGGDF